MTCHLWRKTEDVDLVVKVRVLEVRLHVGLLQPGLSCQHHSISGLGRLSFLLSPFTLRRLFWDIYDNGYLQLKQAGLDVKGEQCEVHVAGHCWLLQVVKI